MVSLFSRWRMCSIILRDVLLCARCDLELRQMKAIDHREKQLMRDSSRGRKS